MRDVEQLTHELRTAKRVIRVLYANLRNVAPGLAEAMKGESRYLKRCVEDDEG